MSCYLVQAESSGVKFPESKGAGVYLRSGRVRNKEQSTGLILVVVIVIMIVTVTVILLTLPLFSEFN